VKRIYSAVAFLLFPACLLAQMADSAFSAYRQTVAGVSFKMVPVPGGNFKMGSRDGAKNESPQRQLSISPFWMGACEVTFDEYDAFMQDEALSQNDKLDAVTRPSQPYIDMTLGMGKEGGYPANSMQPHGALMYCRWLYLKTGVFYRLPTEAEWEYACRAGSSSAYPFGDDKKDLGRYAWYAENSEGRYHKVGQLLPNAWGLYDMLGNVAEWTLDPYDEAYLSNLADGTRDPLVKPAGRLPRTVRGGTYRDDAKTLRPASRIAADPVWNRRDPQIPKSRWWNADAPFVGFRIVRPFRQPAPEEIESFFKLHLGQ
jgi:formylglycine-generating enzyme required for sulfatase activity